MCCGTVFFSTRKNISLTWLNDCDKMSLVMHMLLSEKERQEEIRFYKNEIVKNCKECNGTGFVDKNGKTYRCSCYLKVYRNVRLLDYGFPRKFLDDVQWNIELLQSKAFFPPIEDYINNFDVNYKKGKGIFLTGPYGRGKTTTECVIAKSVSEKTNPKTHKLYSVAFDLWINLVRKMWNDDYEIKKQAEQIMQADVLILDNIGSEIKNNNEVRDSYKERLETLLRERNNALMPTILSSNLNIDEIGEIYSQNIKDFIQQNAEVIYVSGDNYRQTQNQTELEEFLSWK